MWPRPNDIFTPRLSMFGLIQAIHMSLTLPMSHHWYNEWLDKVEIGMWSIKLSPQPMFEPLVEKKLGWHIHPLFTARLSEFGLIEAIHMSLTLLNVTSLVR